MTNYTLILFEKYILRQGIWTFSNLILIIFINNFAKTFYFKSLLKLWDLPKCIIPFISKFDGFHFLLIWSNTLFTLD